MRGRNHSRCLEWRNRKRAMLRVLLLATAPIIVFPVMADSPHSAGQFLLPPLPLAGPVETVSPGPTINPFCQPAPTSTTVDRRQALATPSLGFPRPVNNRYVELPTTRIQLASGDLVPSELSDDQQTTVRLMPIEPSPSSEAVVTGTVQSNPLVVAEPTSDASTARRAAVSDGTPTTASQETPQSMVASNAGGSSPDAGTEPAAAVVKEGPVSFSLDDETLVDTTKESAKSDPKVKSIANLMQKKEPPKLSIAPPLVRAPVKGAIQFGMATSQARDIDKATSITKGSGTGRTLLVPLPSADNTRAVATNRENDARIVKGVRPRVDVGVPPVAIERMSRGHGVISAPISHVTPVEPAKKANDMAFESDHAIPLEMARAEVRSLKLGSEIRQVQIGDSSICAAIAAGPSQIQLIGTTDGVTRLAVWTATPDGKQNKDVYEIRVGSPSLGNASDPNHIAATLTRSAKAAFPESSVQIRFDSGQMIVDGTCPTEESAKQVLRMIRSACLLPVMDKLAIR